MTEPVRRPRRVRTRAEAASDPGVSARQVMQLRAELVRTRAERDEAQLELKDLQDVIAEANIRSLEHKDGKLNLSLESSRVWMLIVVSHLQNLLDADAGQNYVEWDVKPRGQNDPYRMILVRPGAKSPHELRTDAEVEVARLKAAQAAEDYKVKRIVEAAEAYTFEPFGSNRMTQLVGELVEAVKARYEP